MPVCQMSQKFSQQWGFSWRFTHLRLFLVLKIYPSNIVFLQDDFDHFTMESAQHNIATEEIVNMADLDKVCFAPDWCLSRIFTLKNTQSPSRGDNASELLRRKIMKWK
jgi:hypothetical protein